jgi:hypothetical protein
MGHGTSAATTEASAAVGDKFTSVAAFLCNSLALECRRRGATKTGQAAFADGGIGADGM